MVVARPDLPDVDRSTEHKGSAAGSPGMNPLDEEREASLADEGGASAAVIESQDVQTLRRIAADLPIAHIQPLDTPRPRRRLHGGFFVAGALAVGALGALAFRRR
jgi:hypothetical protein